VDQTSEPVSGLPSIQSVKGRGSRSVVVQHSWGASYYTPRAGAYPAKSNRLKVSHRNARRVNSQHACVEVSARHDDLRVFGSVESSFQTEPQRQQAREELTAPPGGKDSGMSQRGRRENRPLRPLREVGSVHDSRTAQDVSSAGRAAELNNSHSPLEPNTALASATQSSSF